jgi:hypothetical protein
MTFRLRITLPASVFMNTSQQRNIGEVCREGEYYSIIAAIGWLQIKGYSSDTVHTYHTAYAVLHNTTTWTVGMPIQ